MDQLTLPLKAVGTVTGDRLVKFDSTSAREGRKCALSGAGEAAVAIATLSVVSGEGVAAAYGGEARLYCDGSTVNIAVGDPIKSGALGVGVKAATPGDVCICVATEPLTTTGIISVMFKRTVVGEKPVFITNATDTIAVTAAQLGIETTIVASVAGTAALAIPGAMPAGTRITVKKTGSAGAITITPASGTINGGATHVALDAQNDVATFLSDGTNWIIVSSNIA